MKEKLTEKALRALRPDKGLRGLKPRTVPYDVMDNQVSGYGVRVLPTGEVVHVMYCRFPGSKNPTRKKLGRYGNPSLPMGDPEMSLAEARDKAVEWLAKIRRGVDPSREAAQAAQAAIEAERSRKANTFAAVLEAYIAHKADLRTIKAREKEIRRETKPWLDRALADITERDVRELINKIKTSGRGRKGQVGRKAQARHIYRLVKMFFAWAVDNNYLSVSPCARIKTKAFVGTSGDDPRPLDDYEIRAFWRASDRLGYPLGSWFKLLLLTGLRRDEAADASWSEFDFAARRWVIPAERMKGETGKAKPHLVSLTDEIMALLDSLPRFTGGDYLFTTGNGSKPISNPSKAKAALDKLMKEELAKEGRAFVPWTIHNTRDTCRTRFDSIGIPENIAELLIAHIRPALMRKYSAYGFEKEKREALEAWHAKIREIVRPALRAVA